MPDYDHNHVDTTYYNDDCPGCYHDLADALLAAFCDPLYSTNKLFRGWIRGVQPDRSTASPDTGSD